MLVAFQNILNILNLASWNLYASDFLDIIIIAIFFYSLFLFLRRSHNYTVFIGLTFAVLLYIVAQKLNLYLTLLTLRYFAGISIIVVAIIFQSDIRKYFELLGLIGTRQIKVGKWAAKSPTASEIIQACVKMAQEKIGSLIVIQGNDSLDLVLEGGVDLDGIISEEVLLSIFDPNSEGHDGALIINNNRISRFATHLPLSTNFKEIGKRGTRHSAALGLSETTDALCIVVSEEKGKITICKEGKLKTLDEFADLEKELEKYIKIKFSDKPDNLIKRLFSHNIEFKVGALFLASVLWFFTAYQAGIVEKKYSVPIKFEKLAKDLVIDSYTPKEIVVTTKGRGESTFSKVDVNDFEINIESSNLQNGINKVLINEKNITIPAGLSLVNFEPTVVLLTSQRYAIANIPVRTKIVGTLAKGYKLLATAVTPEVVQVLIPQGKPSPTAIQTETIDISKQTESVIIPVKLFVPTDMKLYNADATVNVALTIEK